MAGGTREESGWLSGSRECRYGIAARYGAPAGAPGNLRVADRLPQVVADVAAAQAGEDFVADGAGAGGDLVHAEEGVGQIHQAPFGDPAWGEGGDVQGDGVHGDVAHDGQARVLEAGIALVAQAAQ